LASLLYAYVIIRLNRRYLVWINTSTNPTAEWVARQTRHANISFMTIFPFFCRVRGLKREFSSFEAARHPSDPGSQLRTGPWSRASYPPLDCAKSSTAAETAICKSYALGQDEARMATLFGVLTSLVAMGQRSDLIDTQRLWISVREACGNNVGCLSRAYETRINELSQVLDAMAKRGPF
jgi:uncharacterized protein YecT (DUF1311 family)